MQNKKLLTTLVLGLLILGASKSIASLTFSDSAISGTAPSSIDVGTGNTLSLQTTNNGPITTGTGLTTLGGGLNVIGNLGVGTTERIRFNDDGVGNANIYAESDTSSNPVNLNLFSQAGGSVKITKNVPDLATSNTSAFTINATHVTTNASSSNNTFGMDVNLTGNAVDENNATTFTQPAALNVTTMVPYIESSGSNWTQFGSYGINVVANPTSTSRNSTIGVGSYIAANASAGDATAVAGTSVMPDRGIGVYGASTKRTTTKGKSLAYGGYFTLSSNTTPPAPLDDFAGLVADNGDVTQAIFKAKNNGVDVFTIANGGAVTATQPITSTQFKLSALNTAPANATVACTAGEIRIASGYIYVCVATNSWQRSAMAAW